MNKSTRFSLQWFFIGVVLTIAVYLLIKFVFKII